MAGEAPETSSRRQTLYRAKLRGLVRGQFGAAAVDEAEDGVFVGGATLRRGGRGWVIAEEHPTRAVGAALAWATHREVTELHVLVGGDGPRQARRAAYFRDPPQVWSVVGAALEPAEPDEMEAPPVAAPELRALAPVIEAAGADAVEEHGVVLAEVWGLEVGRAVLINGEPRLLVGVGKHDREAHHSLHGDVDVERALAEAVDTVRRNRLGGQSGHPADQLAPERWLRSAAIAAPGLVGAAVLQRFPPPFSPADLRERVPAPAVGEDADGAAVLVVCSVGIDTELVPVAAEAREQAGVGRLVLAVPEGDERPVTAELAARLREPAEVRTVTRRWRDALLGTLTPDA